MASSCQKILIVEDESIVALDLSRRLVKMGYEVLGTAARGEKAIKMAEETGPDLILMDIRIKGDMDGIEVAERVKQIASVPIIFLTAYAEDTTLDRAKATKPYGYLLKPYSEKDLHVTIQVALERFRHDLQITQRESHLRLALDVTQAGTWEKSSPASPILFGYLPQGKMAEFSDWQHLQYQISDDQRAAVHEELEKLSHSACEIALEFETQNGKDQFSRWYSLNGKSYFDVEQQRLRAIGVIQEITQRKVIEARLKQASLVYDYSAEGIIVLNADKKVLSINSAFETMTGFNENEVLNRELPLLRRKSISDKLYEEVWQKTNDGESWQGELRIFCKNGEIRYVWANIALVTDSHNRFGKYVVVLSDITEVHNTQEQLEHIAYHDNLTGLPNRNLLRDRLGQALAKSERLSQKLAVLFIDLDHFKRVNDTLGHQAGDSMLVAITQRLQSEIRSSDTLARIGGDEFIVVLDNVRSEENAASICEKLLATISNPLIMAGVELTPGGSIGVSMYPDHGRDPDELIKNADMAMYSVKTTGRNQFNFFSPEMSDYTTKYFSREQELRKALKNDELRLFYQPQFRLDSGECVGCEALIRWLHPISGLLGADEIIPYAEHSSLMVDVGDWVINEVFEQINRWQRAGYKTLPVSINISVSQLEDNDFVQRFIARLNEKQIKEKSIELEITESCLQDNEKAIKALSLLAERGVAIAVDDFGTGYSCMSSLKHLPLTRIKIDRQFIKDIPHDENDCSIVNAILALAKQLQLEVVAEGIETEAQKAFLTQAGCEYMQGFLLAMPMTADDFIKRVHEIHMTA